MDKLNKAMRKILNFFVVAAKNIAIGLVLISLLFGGRALAQEQKADAAGITPLSYFYFLDRLGEGVQELLTFGWYNRLVLQGDRITERIAELQKVSAIKGYDSAEADGLWAQIAEQYRKRVEVWAELQKRQSAGVKYADYDLDHEYTADENSVSALKNLLIQLNTTKAFLREDIIKARKAGDDAKVQELLAELSEAKEAHTRTAQKLGLVQSVIDLERERVEELFSSKEKAQIVIGEIGRAKKRILAEAQKLNIEVSRLSLAPLDALLRDAKEAYDKQSYGELDKAIKTDFKKIRNSAEKQVGQLEKEKEDNEKLKVEKEAERKEREVKVPEQKKETEKQQEPLPLGITDTSELPGPIVFNPLANFYGKVGDNFEYSFCQPDLTRTSDICTTDAWDPTGGKPPYHFQLGSGVGFPPFGVALNLNGILRGTPTAEGERTFSVCAVDLAGLQACRTVIMNVVPKEEEQVKNVPAPEPGVPLSATIGSVSCTVSQEPGSQDSYQQSLSPTYITYYNVHAVGTVSGPDGAELRMFLQGNSSSYQPRCASWGIGGNCERYQRQEGQPATTQWVFDSSLQDNVTYTLRMQAPGTGWLTVGNVSCQNQ